MSKKMSIQDMKEVKKIVANLLASMLNGNPVITCSIYQNKPSFHTHVDHHGFGPEAKQRVHSSVKELKELEIAQEELLEKKLALINKLTKKESEADNDYEEDVECYYDVSDRRYHDIYNIILSITNRVETILMNKVNDDVNSVREEFFHYYNQMETRVFDAYTKGMSADDFLDIIREEIKDLQTKALKIAEEVKKNGYTDNK